MKLDKRRIWPTWWPNYQHLCAKQVSAHTYIPHQEYILQCVYSRDMGQQQLSISRSLSKPFACILIAASLAAQSLSLSHSRSLSLPLFSVVFIRKAAKKKGASQSGRNVVLSALADLFIFLLKRTQNEAKPLATPPTSTSPLTLLPIIPQFINVAQQQQQQQKN